MLFLRLTWRGIRDMFEMFLIMCLVSILWWISLVGIVTLAPATVALFSMADPRRQVSIPDLSDWVTVFKTGWKRGWGIWLLTVPFIGILLWNVSYFAGSPSILSAMVPLWIVLLVLLWVVTLYAFSMAGAMESGVRNAFRGAMYVLLVRPGLSVVLSVFLMFLATAMTVMVIPMLLFGPSLIASIVNRIALTVIGEQIIDPSSPTDERAQERAAGINPDPGFFSRLRGKKQKPGKD